LKDKSRDNINLSSLNYKYLDATGNTNSSSNLLSGLNLPASLPKPRQSRNTGATPLFSTGKKGDSAKTGIYRT